MEAAFYHPMLAAGWTRVNDGLPGQFISPDGHRRTRVVHAGGTCEIHANRYKNGPESLYSRPHGASQGQFERWLTSVVQDILELQPTH